jgi:hypothetical protein
MFKILLGEWLIVTRSPAYDLVVYDFTAPFATNEAEGKVIDDVTLFKARLFIAAVAAVAVAAIMAIVLELAAWSREADALLTSALSGVLLGLQPLWVLTSRRALADSLFPPPEGPESAALSATVCWPVRGGDISSSSSNICEVYRSILVSCCGYHDPCINYKEPASG